MQEVIWNIIKLKKKVFKMLMLSPTHPWFPNTGPRLGHWPAGLGFDELWRGQVLVLFGLLRLQSQLVGHFKRLTKGQYDLIGQVLWWKKEKRGVRSSSVFWASPDPENNADVYHLKKNLSKLKRFEPDKWDHLCFFFIWWGRRVWGGRWLQGVQSSLT